jgi:hypothetical protein
MFATNTRQFRLPVIFFRSDAERKILPNLPPSNVSVAWRYSVDQISSDHHRLLWSRKLQNNLATTLLQGFHLSTRNMIAV